MRFLVELEVKVPYRTLDSEVTERRRIEPLAGAGNAVEHPGCRRLTSSRRAAGKFLPTRPE